jgi:hypothetical protein
MLFDGILMQYSPGMLLASAAEHTSQPGSQKSNMKFCLLTVALALPTIARGQFVDFQVRLASGFEDKWMSINS